MFELKYHRPQNWQELETTLVDAWRTPTTTVIEMAVSYTHLIAENSERFTRHWNG